MLLDVLEQARTELVPGATGAEIFANMHARIVAAVPDGELPHHGGHALGLTSFEDPHLIPSDTMPFEPWMVLAVEPGVYVEGRYGARVENVFVVTPEGGVELRAALAAATMGARRLHHTGYTVSDLDRSVAFYRDLLGCEVLATQEKEGGYLAAIVGYPDAHVRMAHLRVPGGEHVIELFEYLAPAGDRADVEPRNIGASHLCFIVADLPALYELAARARGYVVRLPTRGGRHGHQPGGPGALPAGPRRDHGRAVPASGCGSLLTSPTPRAQRSRSHRSRRGRRRDRARRRGAEARPASLGRAFARVPRAGKCLLRAQRLRPRQPAHERRRARRRRRGRSSPPRP